MNLPLKQSYLSKKPPTCHFWFIFHRVSVWVSGVFFSPHFPHLHLRETKTKNSGRARQIWRLEKSSLAPAQAGEKVAGFSPGFLLRRLVGVGSSVVNWVVVSINSYFHPEHWGNDPIWLAHIFQMGWSSHQVVNRNKTVLFVRSWGGYFPMICRGAQSRASNTFPKINVGSKSHIVLPSLSNSAITLWYFTANLFEMPSICHQSLYVFFRWDLCAKTLEMEVVCAANTKMFGCWRHFLRMFVLMKQVDVLQQTKGRWWVPYSLLKPTCRCCLRSSTHNV